VAPPAVPPVGGADPTPRVPAAGPASLAAWLATVRPHLAPNLAGAGALARMERLARHLPADVHAVLEIRLGPCAEAGLSAGRPVDLSIRLLSPAACLQVAPALRPSPLRDLAAAWQGDPTFRRTVSALWVELDLARSAKSARSARGARGARGEDEPEPILCARLERPCAAGWLTGTLLPALAGRRPTPAQGAALQDLVAALPRTARPLYLFSLQPRGAGEARLELFGPARQDVAPFVERIAGRAAARQVADPLRLLGDLERLHLSLDVGPAGEISPRIGLDGSYRRGPGKEPRWQALLDRLVEAELCTAAERDAILRWPGHDSFWTDPSRWPLPGGAIGGHAVRALSHVKLVTRPDTAPRAKVYLLFGHVPRRGAGRPVPRPGNGPAPDPPVPSDASRGWKGGRATRQNRANDGKHDAF